VSLNESLERYSGVLLSSRYAAELTDFKIQRPGDSDLAFTMLFSRDDFDVNQQRGRDVEEVKNKVIGFVPAVYTIDDIDYPLVPDSNLFLYQDSKWYRWESTQESDGGGFMLVFTRADLNVAAYQANRR